MYIAFWQKNENFDRLLLSYFREEGPQNQILLKEKLSQHEMADPIVGEGQTLPSIEELQEALQSVNQTIISGRQDMAELSQIEGEFIFRLPYQVGIKKEGEEAEVKEEKGKESKLPLTSRIGINPEVVKKAAGYNIATNRLHYVEQEVLSYALTHLDYVLPADTFLFLKKYDGSDSAVYPNNAIVVDIFARENARIKIDKAAGKTGYPETHTVVLWKKTDKEIVLIDPNRILFSGHIPEGIKSAFPDLAYEVLTTTVEKGVIYSTQISEDRLTSRDCIDIAVKIAFELNEQQMQGKLLDEIEKEAYGQISNLRLINPSLAKDTLNRKLQASAKEERRSASGTEAEKKLNQNLLKEQKKVLLQG